MSGLPMFFRALIRTGPLPLSGTAAASFMGRSAADLSRIATQAVDLLGDGLGTALIEAGLAPSQVPPALTAAALRSDPDFAPVLAGERTLARHDEGPAVRAAQRLLQAVGARRGGAPAELALSVWGADGDWGDESIAATAAARVHFGLKADGPFGAVDAHALLAALADARPTDLLAPLPPEAKISAGALRICQIAEAIAAATPEAPYTHAAEGTTFSYCAEDFGVAARLDGALLAPGGVRYGLRTGSPGYWKCNILGGIVITLAGLPNAAFYWSDRVRTLHFPRTERFGACLRVLPGWQQVRHLDHRDPDDETQPLRGPAQQAEILELLREALPGDLLFVDHPGAPGNNGGHTRITVAVAAADDPDAAPAFVQAGELKAVRRRDGLAALGGGAEIQLWLLRFTG